MPKLPYGSYAVSVYLDVNGDRELNKNFLGIPREPGGVSGNPSPRLGPPRYRDCRFEIDKEDVVVAITLLR